MKQQPKMRAIKVERVNSKGNKVSLNCHVEDSEKIKLGNHVTLKEEGKDLWWKIVFISDYLIDKKQIDGIKRFKFPSIH